MRLVRLFIDNPFVSEQSIELLQHQYHYLVHVLRFCNGQKVNIFNGHQGEWQAILELEKKRGLLIPKLCLKPQLLPGVQILLLQGIIKRQEIVIEKATELGISEIFPLKMEYSSVRTFNHKKAQQWVIAAAEQCERLSVPIVHELNSLKETLINWPKSKKILWAAERSNGLAIYEVAKTLQEDFALLIGPEGGISSLEQQDLKNHPSIIPVSLGQTILRSETAVITAIALALAAVNQ